MREILAGMKIRLNKRLIFIALGVVAVLAAAAGAFLLWASHPRGPSDVALDALKSDEEVAVHRHPRGWYVFVPSDRLPGEAAEPWGADPLRAVEDLEVGLVFYPGGRVDYRSYAPLMREIAARGYPAVLVPAPLNLMVFAPNRAVNVIGFYPKVREWAVGGHSLGAAMAASFVESLDPEEVARSQVRGLLMIAGYPPGDEDLSERTLGVLSIAGGRDEVFDREKWTESRLQLPSQSVFEVIEGGNHAGFGNYGRQPGDGEASISRDEQQRRTAEAIADFLGRLRPVQ